MASIERETKILLMHQDEQLISDISGMLEQNGYILYIAKDLNQATEIVVQNSPELGIFEVSEDSSSHLNSAIDLHDNHELPFMVISGCSNSELISTVVLSGALSYLLRPITSSQLIPIIESALKRADEIRRLRSAEENLSAAIDTSRIISAAIGIIMERFRLTNKMAFELLRSEARSNQKKIIELASEILNAAETVNNFNLINNTVKK